MRILTVPDEANPEAVINTNQEKDSITTIRYDPKGDMSIVKRKDGGVPDYIWH